MSKTKFAHVFIHQQKFIQTFYRELNVVLFCNVKGVEVKGLYSFKNVINDVSATVNELS